jgi:predicted Zn-dependent protease
MATDPDIRERADKAIGAWHAGDTDAAVAELRTLVELAPDDASLAFMLGAYLWDAGHADEAVPYLRRVVTTRPSSERATRFLFHALWDSGRKEQAAQCLRRFLKVREVAEFETVLRDVEEHVASDASQHIV